MRAGSKGEIARRGTRDHSGLAAVPGVRQPRVTTYVR